MLSMVVGYKHEESIIGLNMASSLGRGGGPQREGAKSFSFSELKDALVMHLIATLAATWGWRWR